MKAFSEIGLLKAYKYLFGKIALAIYRLLLIPQLKNLFLKILGANIKSNVILEHVKFFNVYRKGFKALQLGENVYIGHDCLLDLADQITMEKNVTLGERVLVLTHTNVGYADHPLQATFPAFSKGVLFKEGCFIGSGAIILPGVVIGEKSFVAAGSIVTADVPASTLVGGNPAREIRKI